MKKRNYNLIIGGIIAGFMTVFVIVGYFWTPYDPNAISATEKLCGPSLQHLLGTDNFGRDILSRIMDGAGTTFFIAFCVVIIGVVFGVIAGSFTGYFGGLLDEALMRFNDVVAAFPSILLALVFISLMGYGKYNVIISLGVLFIPSFARIVRGEFVRCKSMDYVQNARLMGAGPIRVMFLHILPNCRDVLLSTLAIGFNNAVLAEASMSYLGIGVQPPDASLGKMLSESQTYLFSSPWYAIFTGVTIILLILGFSLLGEGLKERSGRSA